jgi:hypothetical protein
MLEGWREAVCSGVLTRQLGHRGVVTRALPGPVNRYPLAHQAFPSVLKWECLRLLCCSVAPDKD